MLESALAALQSLADPGLLLMLVIGVAAGLVMGLIPGLGGTGAVAILLPVTFGMEAPQALALLIGALAVVHTSDTVSRSEEHSSELQSRQYLVCRLLLEKKVAVDVGA